MIYVALLRGINVGGKNMVNMQKLKTTFETTGFSRVVTYINSGNIVFTTRSKDLKAITAKIERAIVQDFQLEVPVVVRSFENIQTICETLPRHWVKDAHMRTDVMFLREDYDDPAILDQLHINPVDNVTYIAGAVLWNVTGENYTKSGMLKLLSTKAYKHMTIRNVNTVRKLYAIMAAYGNAS